jgi:hypothetical protein
MISCFSHKFAFRALALAAVLAFGAVAQAQLQFKVQLDTSSLVGNSNGPFALDFQLNDGAAWGDGNNSALISNFQFGGGGPLGSASTFGGSTGDLWSSVTLKDTAPFNEFFQSFIAGSWLSFTVSLTKQIDSGPTPDVFTFALLDKNLFNIPTRSIGSDAFIQIDLNSASPWIFSFASADGTIAAPLITPIPEASTYGLYGGLALLALLVIRRRNIK